MSPEYCSPRRLASMLNAFKQAYSCWMADSRIVGAILLLLAAAAGPKLTRCQRAAA